MTLFTQLVDRIETAVNDTANAAWSPEVIATFLNDGIRDYSQHFPRVISVDLSTVVDDHKYDLPVNFLSTLTVEYPADLSSPEFLSRRSYTAETFWGESGYFDVIRRDDAGNPSEIWISQAPGAGETIRVEYRGLHDLIVNVTVVAGTLTVPIQHEPILIKYSVWQCSKYLQLKEEQSPTSNSSLLMSQYASNTSRNKREYEAAMAQALFAVESKSVVTKWAGGYIY